MDTPEMLQLRLQAATPQDTSVGFLLESPLAWLGERRGATAALAVQQEVLGHQPLVGFFRYPVAHLLRLLDLCAQQRSGDEPYHLALADIGGTAARQFVKNPFGVAMRLVASGNVHRLLSGVPSGYRSAFNFGTSTYEPLGERAGRLVYQGDLLGPAWTQAATQQLIESLCRLAVRAHAQVQDTAGTRYTLHFEW